MEISVRDKQILRELAQKYMEYATLPVQEEKRALWRSLNRLDMQKPMVGIFQMPWEELDVDGSLICQVENPVFRKVEENLRCQIYKWEHLPVDMVLNPYIGLERPVRSTGLGISIVEERPEVILQKEGIHSSARFVNQLEEMEDIEKIKVPVLTLDRQEEAELFAAARDIFDGIAPVRPTGLSMHLGIWDSITFWMGVENIYFDLMDRPEFLHAIMERLTEVTIRQIEQVNALGVQDRYENNCHCSYTFDDTPSPEDPFCTTTHDGWAFGMAQLFTSVSPAVTKEFEVEYMKRLFPYFRSIYYGCCERLDDRLELIDLLPNVRKVSCSPWSDRENFARKLSPKYIMSNKPNPALLAEAVFDEDAVRADLRRTIRAAKENGLCLELLLKDITTVRGEPKRLWRWAQIASEETMRAALT